MYSLSPYDALLFNSIFFYYYYFWVFFFHRNDGGLKFYTLFLLLFYYYYFYIEKINNPMSQYGIEILNSPLSIFSPS